MEKNGSRLLDKKRMYLLLIFVISMFVCIKNVGAADGTAMYMECYFSEKNCGGSDSCKDSVDWNTFFVINGDDGRPRSLVVNSDIYFNISENDNFYIFTFPDKADIFKMARASFIGLVSESCWFKKIDDIDNDCSKYSDKEYEGSAVDLRLGVCPVGVRAYKIIEKDFLGIDRYNSNYKNGKATFRVLAGKSFSSPTKVSLLENIEYVVYQLNGYYDNDGKYHKTEVYVFEIYDLDGTYSMIFYDKNSNNTWKKIFGTHTKRFYKYISYDGSEYQPLDLYDGLFCDGIDLLCQEEILYSENITLTGFTQIMRIYNIKDKASYYKVASEFDAKVVSIAGISRNDKTYVSPSDVKVIFSSEDNSVLGKDIIEWFNSQFDVIDNKNNQISKIENMSTLIKNSKNLVESAENNKTFEFSDGYNIDTMLNELEDAYIYLDNYTDSGFDNIKNSNGEFGTTDDPAESAKNYIIYKYFGTPNFSDFSDMNNGSKGFNVKYAETSFKPVIEKILDEKDASGEIDLDFVGKIENYVELFTKAILYIDKYSMDFSLSSTQINKVNELREEYSKLADKYDVYTIVDCKGIIGEELYSKIKSAVNVVKIAIPIILIGLGIFDFIKAVFANDDNKMKEAQQMFIKRIGIAVLIFLVPTIVVFLLDLANNVWGFISSDTCGLL